MATSIAKLAIMLTTDTSGMARGFAQAKTQVTGFTTGLSGLAKGAGMAAAGLALLGTAGHFIGRMQSWSMDLEDARVKLDRLTGSAEKGRRIFEFLGDFGGGLIDEDELHTATDRLLAYGVAAERIPDTIKALGDLSITTGQNMETLSRKFVSSQESADKMMTAAKRADGALKDLSDNTYRGQWRLLKENIEDLVKPLVQLGRPVNTEVLRAINSLFLSRGERMDMLFPESAATRFVNVMTEVKGLHDDGAKSAKEIADAWDSIQARGERLRESLRTPSEMFSDSMKEIDGLFLGGAIGLETYQRAAEDAQKSFIEASGLGVVPQAAAMGRTAASTYGSSAGFSAIHAGRAELARMAAQEELQTKHQAEMVRLLGGIHTEVKKPAKEIVFPVVNF